MSQRQFVAGEVLVNLAAEFVSKPVSDTTDSQLLSHLIHACFQCLGFHLTESAPSTAALGDREPLKYRHPRSSMQYLVRLVPFLSTKRLPTVAAASSHTGNASTTAVIHSSTPTLVRVADRRPLQWLLVSAMAIEDGKLVTWSVPVNEYTTPFDRDIMPAGEHWTQESLGQAVVHLDEFMRSLKQTIVDPLAPGLGKEDVEVALGHGGDGAGHGRIVEPAGPGDPLPGRMGPGPDRSRDPLRANRTPFSIGDRDLDPLGSLMPPHSGGGMLVGPDHPMFRPLDPLRSGLGPFPPGAVPPGARFDPIHPFDPFPRPPTHPRGRGRGSLFSGEPDNDELPPPGYGDMFF